MNVNCLLSLLCGFTKHAMHYFCAKKCPNHLFFGKLTFGLSFSNNDLFESLLLNNLFKNKFSLHTKAYHSNA